MEYLIEGERVDESQLYPRNATCDDCGRTMYWPELVGRDGVVRGGQPIRDDGSARCCERCLHAREVEADRRAEEWKACL